MPKAKYLFDVLGLGCTAVDDILYVPAYPRADAKVEVRRRERHCGGLTATALVAAARLGARCAYAGTLGEDESSRFVLDTFRREGVDTRFVVKNTEARPVRSVIIVDAARRTRTIFYDTHHAVGADPARPDRAVVLSARVLLVDRFGIPGMIRAARIARAAGLPVVADFESSDLPRFGELLALTDHLIVSGDFARKLAGARSVSAAVAKLGHEHRVVVATVGAEGCWFLEGRSGRPQHLPAFPVNALDTTGCGDVFHGAYAAALARGLSLAERIPRKYSLPELLDRPLTRPSGTLSSARSGGEGRGEGVLGIMGRLRLASATAALKATGRGGQAGIPTLAKVEAFLRKHRK